VAKRVLIVSLDGATWPILDGLVSQGCMPFLAEMVRKGSHGPLESVLPPVSAPAWSSFMTGKYPDKHGVWDFRNFDAVEKRDYITNASTIRCETIWAVLTRHGRRVLVLNLPFTYPIPNINGVMVSGFDAPIDDETCYHPPELYSELRGKFPSYRAVFPSWNQPGKESPQANTRFVGQLVGRVRQRTAVARHLMGTREWHVAMVHFQETDYVQHRLWPEVADVALGRREGELGRAIWELYHTLDDAVGALHGVAKTQGPDPDVLIVSDHGFGPLRGTVYPNNRLVADGLFARKAPPAAQQRPLGVKRIAAGAVRRGLRLCRRVAGRAQGRQADVSRESKSLHDSLRGQDSIEGMLIDWDGTAAVDVTGDLVGLVFVADPRRVPDVKHALMAAGDDGFQLFRDVFTQQEAYGREADGDGKLMLAVAPEGYTVSRGVRKDGDVRHIADLRGTHRLEGIWAAAGPSFASGQECKARLVDMMPTLLCHLGVPIPEDVDGEVRKDLLRKPAPPTFEPALSLPERVKRYEFTEREGIEERLKALGYLG